MQAIACTNEQVRENMLEMTLPLGDDSIEQDITIDVLIGSDQFWECPTRLIRKLGNKLTALETVFDWAAQVQSVSKCNAVNCTQAVFPHPLRTLITFIPYQQTEPPILILFWEIESNGTSDINLRMCVQWRYSPKASEQFPDAIRKNSVGES